MKTTAILNLLAALLLGVPGVVKAAELSRTVITSDNLAFDYERMIAIFEGNVEIEDPDVRITADRMLMFFEGTNKVRSVTATGNVRFWQGDRSATCKRAIYVSRTGEVILSGDATLSQGKDSVTGDEITLQLHYNSMKVTPAKLVIFAEEGKSRALPFGTRPERKRKTPRTTSAESRIP